MNQLPVRWNTVMCATSGAMAGTNCTALAPVPTTATRFPRRSWSWSQRAEWKVWPVNVSAPSIRGVAGRLSCPVAITIADASNVRPSAAVTVQRLVASSNTQEVTSVFGCTSRSTPYSRATPCR